MKHAELTAALLRPLGLYAERGLEAAEREAVGAIFDGIYAAVLKSEKETLLPRAEDTGLARRATLFAHRPAAPDAAGLRAALIALMGIDGDGFTQAALNTALAGCGLPARVEETGAPGVAEVSFPGLPGIPEGFGAMQTIIEDILPCHLEILYRFWYVSWARFEERFPTFAHLDDSGLSWTRIETLVEMNA